MKKKIIIGISGASGIIYGIHLLQELKKLPSITTHLIITPSAEKTIQLETSYSINQIQQFADYLYDYYDLTASIASGSFLTNGMVVIPCSIKTLSGITNSYNNNLLTRCADVTLKERRKLIVVPRETPLHQGHLELMLKLTKYGGIIVPPVPAFYNAPQSIQDIINHTIGKIMDLLEISHQTYSRWNGFSENP